MARRLRIGLTGGIASGKTTVAQRFIELGVPVIDADVVSRSVVAPGQPGLASVIERFGTAVLDANGELNRRALRALVFTDPAARRDLEARLHPLIRAEMERLAAAAVGPYLVMAIPLLVEGGQTDRFDRILVVDTDEQTQLARLMARDGQNDAQARAILAAQASRAERLARADDLLPNTDGIPELLRGVDRLHEQYLRLGANQP